MLLGTDKVSAQPTASTSEALLGAGAKCAANGGSRALYVDSYDTWTMHGGTDGVSWSWWSLSVMQTERSSIYCSLSKAGLNVTMAGDIPKDLSGYDVVVIASYFACTPSDSAMIRNYIAGGGGVMLYAGVPECFRIYIKGTGGYGLPTDPLSVNNPDWLGFSGYENTGGPATFTLDHPFGTEFVSGEQVLFANGISAAAVTGANRSIIATWQSGPVFACTHEFGQGRLYYQAGLESTLTGKIASYSLCAAPNHAEVTLTWQAPTFNQDAGIDYYVIYQDGVDIAHAKTNSTTVEGLTNGHSYPFAVAAHSTSGIGPLSESAVAIPNGTLTEPLSNSYNGLDFLTIGLMVLTTALCTIALMIVAMYVWRKRSGSP